MKSTHVEPEVLAAWSEGTLPSSAARQVEAHLADCGTCQEMLAVFARTEPPPAVSSGFRSVLSGVLIAVASVKMVNWRWAVPLAAAATVAAIWVAIPGKERTAQLNPTSAPAVSEPVALPVDRLSTDAAASAAAKERAARSDTSTGALADRTAPELREQVARPEQANQFTSSQAANERDHESKAEAAPTARSVAPAQVAAAPAQEQDRSRAEGQATALLRQAAPSEVASPDPQVRWRIVPPGRLERSINAGKTWEPVTLPQPVNVTAVRAPSATTAIVTTADNRQFRTDDQGKTWSPGTP